MHEGAGVGMAVMATAKMQAMRSEECMGEVEVEGLEMAE